MSRGHGRVERAILEALSKRRGERGMFSFGTSADMLAQYVRSGRLLWSVADPYRSMPVTRSEIESVRRALRSLRKQGLVEVTKYRHVVYQAPGKRSRCPD
jgi:hypothetical protein